MNKYQRRKRKVARAAFAAKHGMPVEEWLERNRRQEFGDTLDSNMTAMEARNLTET